MIKIGDICPLFFNPIKNEFQQDIDYIQKFYTTDKILIQIFSDDSEDVVSSHLKNLTTGDIEPISLTQYNINPTEILHCANIIGVSDSVYQLVVEEESTGDVYESEPFSVCSDSIILKETCLIEYFNEDNNSPFNNIFLVDNVQQVFNFRIEGGFKPDGVSVKVDNEQFRNQSQDIVELYSVPYDTYSFTCGNASGIPYWMIQFINNILSLSHFLVNGERYVRSGNAVPEKTQISEDGQMFNMTILLEKNRNSYLLILDSSIESDPKADTVSVNIMSNTRWSFDITEGADFLSYDGKKKGRGNAEVIFNIARNTTTALRNAVVKFFTEDLQEVEVLISQDFITQVTLDKNTLMVRRNGGGYFIKVTANSQWEITSFPDWCTISHKKGDAGSLSILVVASANSGDQVREGNIVFTTISSFPNDTILDVLQDVAGDYIIVDTKEIILDASGSGAHVLYESNLGDGILVESNRSWLHITVISAGYAIVSADGTVSTQDRTGTVYFRSPNDPANVFWGINVTQKGEVPIEQPVNFLDWVNNSNAMISYNSFEILITEVIKNGMFLGTYDVPLTVPSFKIKVTGITDGQSIGYQYCNGMDEIVFKITSNGEYTLPESVHSEVANGTGFGTFFRGTCDILIQKLTN